MKYTEKQVAQRRRGMLKHRYKISPETYEFRLKLQGGVCILCKRPPDSIRLSVDHDHKCCPGRNSCGTCIRGLICQPCNAMLGYIESHIGLMERLVDYHD